MTSGTTILVLLALVSLLGCVCSLSYSAGRKNRNRSSIGFREIRGNGECRGDDVVIVGAGVVGSALAYALGKVIIIIPDSQNTCDA